MSGEKARQMTDRRTGRKTEGTETGMTVSRDREENREGSRERAGKGCIACGGELHILGTFRDMPASAQDIPDAEEIKTESAIELRLCQCESCGLVQFPVEPVHYYKDVIRAGGGTRTMTRLRHEEYKRLLSELLKQHIRRPKILEVGCGRGEFLEMWGNLWEDSSCDTENGKTEEACREGQKGEVQSKDFAGETSIKAEASEQESREIPGSVETLQKLKPILIGIEHKPELVRMAKERGLTVYEDFAEEEKELPEAPFDAFVQFNFLEHQPKPLDMLKTIHKNLKAGGLGLLTVPSFEYILAHNGYYELLRDHIANYTEETLQFVLQEAGFVVLSMRIVNRDTIEALVQKEEPEDLMRLCFNGNFIDIAPLSQNYELLKKEIREHISELKAEGKTLATWGASHQGFTLASSTELHGMVSYIIDSADFKQGRFSPASHIPIVAPEHFFIEPVDEILIVAPGYTDEIADIIRSRFGEQVKILELRGKSIRPYQRGGEK